MLALGLLPLAGCSLLFAPSNDGPAPDETAATPDAASAASDGARAPEPTGDAATQPVPDAGAGVCSPDIVPKLSILGTAGACGGPALPIALRRGLAFQIQGNNVGGCILADFGVPIPAIEIVAVVETEGACATCSPGPCTNSSLDVYAWRTNNDDAELGQKFSDVMSSEIPYLVTLPFATSKVAVCVAREGTALRVSSLRAVCN